MKKNERIISDITNKINSGIWEMGQLMPTESELCSAYSVSRITVRKALDILEAEGKIYRIQGKGTFVGKSKSRSDFSPNGFKRNLELQGIKVTSRLIEKKIVKPTPFISKALNIGEKEDVYLFRRLRFADDYPIAIMNTYVKKDYGERMLRFDLESMSFYDIFYKLTGQEVSNTVGTIRALTGSDEECSLLSLPLKAPLLWFRSISYSESGIPFQTDYSVFNPEKYEFSTNMKNTVLGISLD